MKGVEIMWFRRSYVFLKYFSYGREFYKESIIFRKFKVVECGVGDVVYVDFFDFILVR